MKTKLAALALGAFIVAQIGAAKADDASTSTTTTTTTTETSASAGDHGPVWNTVAYPFRLVTGVGGGAVGAVTGGAKGIWRTEKTFAENTFGKANENPFLVPVGILGTVVAIPVGFVSGMPQGASEGAEQGFDWWGHY